MSVQEHGLWDAERARRFSRWAAISSRLVHAPLARKAVAGLPRNGSGATIVDLGSGPGHLALELHKLCPEARIVGVDPSDEMLRIAREYAAAADFAGFEAKLGTAEELPLESDSVDLLITQSSFHEWQDQAVGLAEAYRVLKAEGTLLIKDYNRAWLSPWKRKVLGLLDHLEMFRYGSQNVARLLGEAGFLDVSVRGEGAQFLVQGRKP